MSQRLVNGAIDNNFSYHKPNDKQVELYDKLRMDGREMAYLIDCRCPDSREKALALTKLEECIMWANASIARNKQEQVNESVVE